MEENQTLANLLRQKAESLINAPTEFARNITDPQAFLKQFGYTPNQQLSGFSAGYAGVPEKPPSDIGVLDPNNIEYNKGYGSGEFANAITGVAAPLASMSKPFVKPVAKAIGEQALNATENMMANQGLMPSIVPRTNVVSTRVPTAVKATENPLTSTLLSDYATAKKEPNIFEHHINLMSEYPHLTSKAKSVEGKAEDFVKQSTDNLLWLHDQVPIETRGRSKLWYDGARNIVDRWGKEYGIPDQAASGVLAVLSPQKDWFMNVSLGNRVIDIMKNQQAYKWDKAMQNVAGEIWDNPKYKPMLNAIKGKRLEDLTDPVEKAMWLRTFDQAHLPREHQIVTPEGDFSGVRLNKTGEPSKTGWGSLNEIAKAVSIYENPTKENVSKQLGGMHKVRNFYNNIYDPNNPLGFTTIDTHAVAANALRPFSGKSREVAHNFNSNILGETGPSGSAFSGLQGTYPIQYEPYQRAAKERGVLPREMQSITWEAIRGLFPDTFKTAANTKIIDDIWAKVKAKKLSINDARNQILEKTGGINEPEWKK